MPITNSLGLRLVEIPAGTFVMGQVGGDAEWDESPVHRVVLGRPLWMAATTVTNAQYEQFDPGHSGLRGQRGTSSEDDEPAVYVCWHDAVRFCDWLSQREGKLYRLPTEAEWEYACRAGTYSAFWTGDTLPHEHHRHQEFGWDPTPVALHVGQTPANPWGLHDMHGGVEEWCLDWYGPYEPSEQVDPVGPAEGLCRVTRGGSHNTPVAFLRSANRSGALPEDRHWLIGFRIVQAGPPGSVPVPVPRAPLWARDIAARDAVASRSRQLPLFAQPLSYVRIPPGANGPLYARHNHCPSIAWCGNGDMLAIWFSCNTERGREMSIAASRLRSGAGEWDPAEEFLKAPDRNMTGSALLNDGRGKLYHFNGIEAGGGWANLALAMRTSGDDGATWSRPVLICPEHHRRNQVISGTLLTREGWIVQPCDAVWSGNGGTAVHISRDGGLTWEDPGAGTPAPEFVAGGVGHTIAGIHAGVTQLADGNLLAFGRGDSIPDAEGRPRMPLSRSADMGRTWTYAASPWPPIGGGQRLVLMRLREGPLLFVSFTDASERIEHPEGLPFSDANGDEATGYGAFIALSYDDGSTWPVCRLLTDGVRRSVADGRTGDAPGNARRAEPKGYMAATQAPDGVIHVVSSQLHYRFNVSWLEDTGMPPHEESA